MSSQINELEKEFELERMILFSDAVFAIAITLLIIEIKFPDIPKGALTNEIVTLFKPAIAGFVAFMISFFFVGLLWSRHLNIFKYLATYDSGVIFRNLLFLFFIVCFPFSASGLEHLRPSFLLPLHIYIVNLAFVFMSQYFLCNYIFNRKKSLTKPGYEVEKRYILLTSKYAAIAFVSGTTAIVLLFVILPANLLASGMAENLILVIFMIIAVALRILKRKLKKFKPSVG